MNTRSQAKKTNMSIIVPAIMITETLSPPSGTPSKMIYNKCKLRDWISIKKLNFRNLCINDNALKLLEQNQEKIDWNWLSFNSNDIALKLLKKQNQEKINWDSLSLNTNDIALKLLQQNPMKINWKYLACNPNDIALKLLQQNPENIDWRSLSENSNDMALKLLQDNPEKINWVWLSKNSNDNALKLLQQNPDKIDWDSLSRNPKIFERDYIGMSQERTQIIYQELIEKSLHPCRVLKWMEEGFEDF